MQDQRLIETASMYKPSLFKSFPQGGFDCSTEVRGDGRRLDLLLSSGHEMLAAKDYALLAQLGLTTIRDGLRWHLIEASPGQYDWSSFLPMLHAAQANHMQVIWDLCHFGWPDHMDIWRDDFIKRFAHFAGAVAERVRAEGITAPWYTPINAISYLAWAGGDVAHIQPMASGRGDALKVQLVKASLAAMDAILAADGSARFLQPEPVVHIATLEDNSAHINQADALRLAQFDVWDMLSGKLRPELGGAAHYLDVPGLIYRPNHQWFHQGETIAVDDSRYRPLAVILQEIYNRYGRPMLIAETGAEQDLRAPWMRYIFEQAVLSMKNDVAVEGICLYPVADYRSWSSDKHQSFGLLGMPDVNGCRSLYEPLAIEIRSQQLRLKGLLADTRPDESAMPA